MAESEYTGRNSIKITPDGKLLAKKLIEGYDNDVLPSGYTPLEYIGATGTQYIDTGITPTVADETLVRGAFMLTNISNGGNIQALGVNYNINFYAATSLSVFRPSGYETTIPLDTNKHTYSLQLKSDGRYCRIDGELFVGSMPSSLGNYTFCLGAMNGGDTKYYGQYRIYQTRIYNSNVLVRNLIPCRKESGSELGMYDTVTDTFYGNAGSGSFTRGGYAYSVDYNFSLPFCSDTTNTVKCDDLFEKIGNLFASDGLSTDEYDQTTYLMSSYYNGTCELVKLQNGIRCFKITNNPSTSYADGAVISGEHSDVLTIGSTYQISGWAYVPTGLTIRCSMLTTDGGYGAPSSTTIVGDNDWHFFSKLFTATSNSVYNGKFETVETTHNSTSYTWYITGLRLIDYSNQYEGTHTSVFRYSPYNTGGNDRLCINEIIEGYKMLKSPVYVYGNGGDSVTITIRNPNPVSCRCMSGSPVIDTETDTFIIDTAASAASINAGPTSAWGWNRSTESSGKYYFQLTDINNTEGIYSPVSYNSKWSVEKDPSGLVVNKTGYGSTYSYSVIDVSAYGAVQYKIGSGSWTTVPSNGVLSNLSDHNISFRWYRTGKLWHDAVSYSYTKMNTPTVEVRVGSNSTVNTTNYTTTGTGTKAYFYVTTRPNAQIAYGTTTSYGSTTTADSSGHAWIGPYTSTTTLHFQAQPNSATYNGFINSDDASATCTKLSTPSPTRSGYGDSVTLSVSPTSGATAYYGTSSSSQTTSGSSVSVSNTTTYYFKQTKPGYIDSSASSGIAALQCSVSTIAVRAGDSTTVNSTNFSGSTRGRYAVVYFSGVTGSSSIGYSTTSGSYTNSIPSTMMTTTYSSATTVYYKVIANQAGYLSKTGSKSITKATTPTLTKSGGGSSVTVTASSSTNNLYKMSSNTRVMSSGTSQTTATLTSTGNVYWISAPTDQISSDVKSLSITEGTAPTITKSGIGTVTLSASNGSGSYAYSSSPDYSYSSLTTGTSVTVTTDVSYYFTSWGTGTSATLYSDYTLAKADTPTVTIQTYFSNTAQLITSPTSDDRGKYGAVYFSTTNGGTITYTAFDWTGIGDPPTGTISYENSLSSGYTSTYTSSKYIYYKCTAVSNGYVDLKGTTTIGRGTASTLSWSYNLSDGGYSVDVDLSGAALSLNPPIFYISSQSPDTINQFSPGNYGLSVDEETTLTVFVCYQNDFRQPAQTISIEAYSGTPLIGKTQDGDHVALAANISDNSAVVQVVSAAASSFVGTGGLGSVTISVNAAGDYSFAAYTEGKLFGPTATTTVSYASVTATKWFCSSSRGTYTTNPNNRVYGKVKFTNITNGTLLYSTTSGSYTTSPDSNGFTTYCSTTTTYYFKVTGTGGYLSKTDSLKIQKYSLPAAPVLSGGGVSITLQFATSGTYYSKVKYGSGGYSTYSSGRNRTVSCINNGTIYDTVTVQDQRRGSGYLNSDPVTTVLNAYDGGKPTVTYSGGGSSVTIIATKSIDGKVAIIPDSLDTNDLIEDEDAEQPGVLKEAQSVFLGYAVACTTGTSATFYPLTASGLTNSAEIVQVTQGSVTTERVTGPYGNTSTFTTTTRYGTAGAIKFTFSPATLTVKWGTSSSNINNTVLTGNLTTQYTIASLTEYGAGEVLDDGVESTEGDYIYKPIYYKITGCSANNVLYDSSVKTAEIRGCSSAGNTSYSGNGTTVTARLYHYTSELVTGSGSGPSPTYTRYHYYAHDGYMIDASASSTEVTDLSQQVHYKDQTTVSITEHTITFTKAGYIRSEPRAYSAIQPPNIEAYVYPIREPKDNNSISSKVCSYNWADQGKHVAKDQYASDFYTKFINGDFQAVGTIFESSSLSRSSISYYLVIWKNSGLTDYSPYSGGHGTPLFSDSNFANNNYNYYPYYLSTNYSGSNDWCLPSGFVGCILGITTYGGTSTSATATTAPTIYMAAQGTGGRYTGRSSYQLTVPDRYNLSNMNFTLQDTTPTATTKKVLVTVSNTNMPTAVIPSGYPAIYNNKTPSVEVVFEYSTSSNFSNPSLYYKKISGDYQGSMTGSTYLPTISQTSTYYVRPIGFRVCSCIATANITGDHYLSLSKYVVGIGTTKSI